MTNVAARKQARRFFGAMGATMRRTSRWLDTRTVTRADVTIRRAHALRATQVDVRTLTAR